MGWQAINKIENGSRNVTIAEAVAIANAFGVTVNRLTGMAQRPRADRDFALGRLHESVADAQRAARASIRDITTALGELNELRAGLDEAGLDELAEPIAATEAAMTQIDAAATQLAKAGGEIAEARGRRVAWRAG